MEKLRHDLYRTDMKRGNKINYMLEEGDMCIVQNNPSNRVFNFMGIEYPTPLYDMNTVAIFRVIKYKDEKIEVKIPTISFIAKLFKLKKTSYHNILIPKS